MSRCKQGAGSHVVSREGCLPFVQQVTQMQHGQSVLRVRSQHARSCQSRQAEHEAQVSETRDEQSTMHADRPWLQSRGTPHPHS